MSHDPRARPMIRCAIYTRKSNEEGLEQDYNSLDAQRDAGENYIRSQLHEGWMLVQDRYDDPAYSGGNMERPALQRLMADIKSGKVQMVVVYKIDRLSRSLMDFATLARVFEQHGCSFTSVTEQFSTANAIGRLHLNMILSFAQFEREIASERIRDKVAASKKKGLWMGGYPPMGYAVEDRKLLIRPEEAKWIRHIFQRYTETHSLITLARELREADVKTKAYISKRGKEHNGTHLTVSVIHHILRNPVYIGKIEHKGEHYEGQHEALVSQELWDKVQDMMRESPRRKRGRETVGDNKSVLHGMVYCKCCRAPMTHTFTRKAGGRLYRYFTPSAPRRGRYSCTVATISAPELEEMVMGQIRAIIRQPQVITGVWERVNASGRDMTEDQIRRHLLNLDRVWDELFPAEQRQFVDLLVKRIEMTPQGASLHLHTQGMEELLNQLFRNKEEDNGERIGHVHIDYSGADAPHQRAGAAAGAHGTVG